MQNVRGMLLLLLMRDFGESPSIRQKFMNAVNDQLVLEDFTLINPLLLCAILDMKEIYVKNAHL